MTERHQPGRGSQLTPAERREVQELSLLQGLSNSEIARQTGRDRGTVSNVLRAEDSHALREQLATEAADAAVQILRGNSETAARKWVSAVSVAADKGDHRPAKDLLVAVGAISDQSELPRIAIIIGTPEHPIRIAPPTVVDLCSHAGLGDLSLGESVTHERRSVEVGAVNCESDSAR